MEDIIKDYQESCRICLLKKCETLKLYNLFSCINEGTLEISQILMECAPIHVSIDDRLPHYICNDCLYKLEDFSQFRQLCVESDKKLRKLEEEYFNVKIEQNKDTNDLFDWTNFQNSFENNDASFSNDEKNLIDINEQLPLPEKNEDLIKTENKISNVENNETKIEDKLLGKFKMKKIIKKKKSNLINSCGSCSMKFKKISSLIKHIKKAHSNDEKFTCSFCGKQFDDNESLNTHKMNHSIFKCKFPNCHKTYQDLEQLKNHVNNHIERKQIVKKLLPKQEKKEFVCKICKYTFEQWQTLNDHKKAMHLQEYLAERYFCDICQKHYFRKDHFNIHKDIWFDCNICNKKYRSKISLAKHKAYNHKDYYCKICEKYFNSHSHSIVHNNVCFLCDSCGMNFNSNSNLKRHVKVVHKGERKFTCDMCGKQFGTNIALQTHKKTHTNFKCGVPNCGKIYNELELLRAHVKANHYGGQNTSLMCEVCGKSFKLAVCLKKHTKFKHSSEKHFKCKLCPKAFKYSHGLRKHLKFNHELKNSLRN